MGEREGGNYSERQKKRVIGAELDVCTGWHKSTDSEWSIWRGGVMERFPKESGELGAVEK